jgi:hypothetical protein
VRAKIPELQNTVEDSQKMSALISALIQYNSNELVNQLGKIKQIKFVYLINIVGIANPELWLLEMQDVVSYQEIIEENNYETNY